MQTEHYTKKKRRMSVPHCRVIQNERVRRGKTGWSKFVLRAIKHETGNLQAKWTLPHIPPRTRQQFQIDEARRRAKNRDDLIAMLTERGFEPADITAIVGAA